MSMKDDKRQHHRKKVSWPVLWRDSEGMPQQGSVCDVSAGGAFMRPFVGSHMLDLHDGSEVEMLVVVGHNGTTQRTTVSGKVRWRGYHGSHCWTGVGIEFDDSTTPVYAMGPG